MQKVITLIEEDLRRDISLEELAQSVNLSSSRLRHLFRAETGVAPAQYLKFLRMQKAKEMIETTFMSMKEIMSLIGVGDRNHFANDFKKAYGLSPTQYRACHFSGELIAKNRPSAE